MNNMKTAAVHGQPRGFVEYQQALVLMDDGRSDSGHQRRRYPRHAASGHHLSGFGALMDRRHANPVTGQEALFRAGSFAVDAHFALANQSENAGARHGRQKLGQHLIEPLAASLFGDHVLLYRRPGAVPCFVHFCHEKPTMNVNRCF